MNNNCTLWPEKIGKILFSDCCLIHDWDYYNPGLSFTESNKRLYMCVAKRNRIWGLVMFLGVSSPVGYGLWRYAQWQVSTGRI